MIWKTFLVGCFVVVVADAGAQPADSLHEFRRRAGTFNSVITLPQFEITTNEVRVSVRQTIAAGNAALDRIGALKRRAVNFANTIRALDDIGYQIDLTADRLSVLKETSTNAVLREVTIDALKELQEWMVGLDYREDVYKAVKAYAEIIAGRAWTCPRPSATRSNACAKSCRG